MWIHMPVQMTMDVWPYMNALSKLKLAHNGNRVSVVPANRGSTRIVCRFHKIGHVKIETNCNDHGIFWDDLLKPTAVSGRVSVNLPYYNVISIKRWLFMAFTHLGQGGEADFERSTAKLATMSGRWSVVSTSLPKSNMKRRTFESSSKKLPWSSCIAFV